MPQSAEYSLDCELCPVDDGGGGLAAKLCLTLATPWTVACQAPLSMGFSRQEDWSGLLFPSPGEFANPEIESGSPALHVGLFLLLLLLFCYLPTEL